MKYKNAPMYILAAIIVTGYFALLVLLVKNGVPKGNETLFNTAMGTLLASFATVVAYWFGSSKSSSDKNEMLKGGKNEKSS